MTTRFLLAAAVVALTAFPAMAFQCPADMAAIDAALATASLSAEDKAKVEALRKKGEELHAAGNHDASVTALAEAKALLGI